MRIRAAVVPIIIFILGTVFAVAYALYAGPQLNAPLGLDRFNEKAVRAKVLATASKLLPETGSMEVVLEQKTDRTSLERLQDLFGFKAAGYWAGRRVPIQRWKYKIVQGNTRWDDLSLFSSPSPVLEADVSSSGRILALEIPPREKSAGGNLKPEESLKRAEQLLRLLGIDVNNLTLTSTVTGSEKGKQTYDFGWKEPIRGLPGLLNRYSVRLQSGYLVSFGSSYIFAEPEKRSLWKSVVFPILFAGSWLFLVLFMLFILVQKLRRDEMDYVHAKWFALLAGAVTFLKTILSANAGFWRGVVAALLLGALSAVFFGLLFAVGESLLRQSFEGKLRCMDLWLEGKWRVRETGRRLLSAGGAGLLLLALPLVVVVLARSSSPGTVLALPPSVSLDGLNVPGALLVNALLGPLFGVAIFGAVFLGAWYPIVRLRFSPKTAGVLFVGLFTLATGKLLPVGPPLMALALAAAAGLVVFLTMEHLGWLAGLFQLYLPIAFIRVALLVTAKDGSIVSQGWVGLSVLLFLLVLLGYVSLAGKPISELEDYQPAYLLKMRERERFERELEIAKGVQEKFLPKTVPAIPGFQISTACIPAMEVGGDYFDFLPLAGGKWLFLIGDVSGKGVKAAFYMTLVKGILHAVVQEEADAKKILGRLNRLFRDQSEPGVFLTLCFVVLEPSTGDVHLLSAGHNPPLMVGDNGVSVLNPRGLIVGVMEDKTFMNSLRDARTVLKQGESLVLYTDGVTEAMDRNSCEFGMERLRGLLEECPTGGPDVLVQSAIDAVDEFQAGCPQADDITLMIIGR